MSTLDYNTIFLDYILSGLVQMLTRIRAADPLPDEQDREQAWHLLTYAFKSAAAWSLTRDLLLTLAPKMEQAGFRDDWLPYLEHGLQLSQLYDDHATAAELALQIGILQRLVSKFEQARHWLTVSMERFTLLEQQRNRARVLNELAWLDYLQQRYQSAADYAEQALALLNVEDTESGMSYRALGMIAINQERWQQAEIYHRKALTLFEAEADLRKLARGLANLANTLRGQGKFQESFLYHERAAAMFEKLGDVNHLAIVQMNLGRTRYQFGELSQAILCHKKAEEIFRNLYDRFNLAHNYTNLGLSYLALFKFTEAEENFLAAISIYEKLGETGWRLNAMDGLAMTHLGEARYGKAIGVLEQALAELPTVRNSSNYNYLHHSLNEHLLAARDAQESLAKLS